MDAATLLLGWLITKSNKFQSPLHRGGCCDSDEKLPNWLFPASFNPLYIGVDAATGADGVCANCVDPERFNPLYIGVDAATARPGCGFGFFGAVSIPSTSGWMLRQRRRNRHRQRRRSFNPLYIGVDAATGTRAHYQTALDQFQSPLHRGGCCDR